MEARETHDGGRWRRGSCRRWWSSSLHELSLCGGGCGMCEEDANVVDHWCNNDGKVSDEGATGDDFPAWAMVARRGHGCCGVWRLRSGLVRKREKKEIRVRVLVV
ncbi:hypothetical protein DEO72_LG8g2363 [Vigna unguiculata]|uniref:Uncharacterized protein n=1 Tax=Vigna unguiculata TaxID=3917 RepID=A0A4D6MWS6_VIGUN|nr:hypothetical protein DEO72_LG8g2363 [Vigna unguiculata]